MQLRPAGARVNADRDACAVATRFQLVIGGDAVLLAAEHFNLTTWTATGLLQRVRAPV